MGTLSEANYLCVASQFILGFLAILQIQQYDFPIYRTEIWGYARLVFARLVKILSYHGESVQIVV